MKKTFITNGGNKTRSIGSNRRKFRENQGKNTQKNNWLQHSDMEKEKCRTFRKWISSNKSEDEMQHEKKISLLMKRKSKKF